MTKGRVSLLAVFCLVAGAVPVSQAQGTSDKNVVYDAAFFQALRYRMIGPFRGGRVTAVAGVRGQKHTYYMGSTGGGVWKTTDGGERWRSISDGYFEAGSIGSVTVAESDPNVIYVGTGSSAIRGNVSAGVGMYKSTDAGKTWKHVGLREGGQIGDIQVHPTNPDVVYAAVLGHAFGPNDERGVFRSRDGGATWEKVHFVSDRTGCIDLSMDESNPDVLFAAMWTAERKPWTIISGSEESGLFKTTDGGDTWTKIGGGLPGPLVGKIEVSISRARPNRIWALVEADEGGVYRSDNGGETWTYLNRERGLRARPWYYNHIHADPKDPEVVYVSAEDFWKSTDGGESFEMIAVPHGDCHDLWINPDDNEVMIESHDGGVNVSYNGGLSWSTMMNQPTAEFYRVTVDNQFPYRVYGGQQDNSTLSVPSRTGTGGITLQHWYAVAGGESAHVAVDPRNLAVSCGGSYGGTLTRQDRRSGQVRDITLYPELSHGEAAKNLKYRVQWNAPIRISPHDPSVIFFTSQHVHRSTNEGESWEVISPDLSHNDPEVMGYSGGPISRDNTGVEVFGTVFALEESPLQKGLIWAGTDDGRVHVSSDAGGNWEDITPPGLAKWGTVNMIDLSTHHAGRAFIAVHRYRLNDFTPYIYGTDDFGKTWKLLTDGTNGMPSNHFVRVVREDPDRKGLLYAGSEFGLYVSFDDGEHWQSLQLNLPVTPIADLAVHQKDLIVATQGRSFWILDDLTPLHQLSAEVARSKAYLYKPRDTYRQLAGPSRQSGNSHTFWDRDYGSGLDWERVGEDGPAGAVVYYYLAAESDDVQLEILEENGDVIKMFGEEDELPGKKGMNRFVWDMRYPDADVIPNTSFRGTTRGPKAVHGIYQVRLTVGGQIQTQSLQVLKDPRVESTDADLKAQFDLLIQLRDAITETYDGIKKIRELKEKISEANDGADDTVRRAGQALTDKLTAIEHEMIEPRIEYREDCWNFPSKLNHFLSFLSQKVGTGDFKPTDSAYERFRELRGMLDREKVRLDETLNTDLPKYNDLLEKTGHAPVS